MQFEVEIVDQTIGTADIMIIMYTYQHEKYIQDAVDSVLMQRTEYKWKLLIMDDGSTDGTQKLLRHYQSKNPYRIILAMSKKNTNSMFQKEILYKYRDVSYINEIDGDDYWTDKFKLDKQIKFLKRHPEYIGVTGNVINVNEDGTKQHCDFNMYPFRDSHIFNRENVLRMEQVSHCSALLFKNFYKDWNIEKFDKMYSCKANGDIVWSSVLGMLGNIYYSYEVYTDHRRVFTGTSWTARIYGKNNAALMLEMKEDLYQLIYEMFGEKIEIEDFRKGQLGMIGKEITKEKRIDEAAKQRNIARMCDIWMLGRQAGNSVETMLQNEGIESVAIYGLSRLGVMLFHELSFSNIDVKYGIDMNKGVSIPGLKCFHEFPTERPGVDAVIVTALTTYDDIKKRLRNENYDRIVALDELLYRMIPEDPYLKGEV